MIPPRLMTRLAAPLRLLDRRSAAIERFIETPLSATDEASIREACTQSGVRFGEFYHWYFQKWLISRFIGGIDRKRALELIASVDHTDFGQLSRITDQPGGVLVAVPHHGHYIFSIIHLAEHLRRKRRVYVFYGRPSTHSGNEIFDVLRDVIWDDGDNVEVIHDTRQGMARAIRGLKNGDVVVIMPDVFKREEDTLVVPFCGRPMNVMLGTAILARKTNAWILPAVARHHGPGMGFRTWFGDRIDHPGNGGEDSADVARILDYRTTRVLFQQLESVMGSELLFWQFVRQHLAQRPGYEPPEKEELEALLKVLSDDPALAPPVQVVDLSTTISEPLHRSEAAAFALHALEDRHGRRA